MLQYHSTIVGIVGYLHSDERLTHSRLEPNVFLRQRVLAFPALIVAMLSGRKASVQNELNAFFTHPAQRGIPVCFGITRTGDAARLVNGYNALRRRVPESEEIGNLPVLIYRQI